MPAILEIPDDLLRQVERATEGAGQSASTLRKSFMFFAPKAALFPPTISGLRPLHGSTRFPS